MDAQTEERFLRTEQRLTALELALKDGRVAFTEIVDTWQEVIVTFAEQYGVDVPDNVKQTESQP